MFDAADAGSSHPRAEEKDARVTTVRRLLQRLDWMSYRTLQHPWWRNASCRTAPWVPVLPDQEEELVGFVGSLAGLENTVWQRQLAAQRKRFFCGVFLETG
jgi:hypothetical protein